MTLPINTPMPLNDSNTQRLVAASLAGKRSHVLCVNVPPQHRTLDQLKQLYTAQSCKPFEASPHEAIIPMLDRLQATVNDANRNNLPLVVFTACKSEAEARAMRDIIAPCIETRAGTALVSVVLDVDSEPFVKHYLNCADARSLA